MRTTCVISLVVLLVSTAVWASPIYTGSLTQVDGGLTGNSVWVDQSVLPVDQQGQWFAPTISWTVSQNADLTWHYQYILNVYLKNISHVIIEVSSGVTAEDILNATGPFEDIQVQQWTTLQGNPDLPVPFYGIKFNTMVGTTVQIDFDTAHQPTWGDFYAKDGQYDSTNVTMWNADFGQPDPMPFEGISGGNKIAVPDTLGSDVPEPASMLLLAVGGVITLLRSRRRR